MLVLCWRNLLGQLPHAVDGARLDAFGALAFVQVPPFQIERNDIGRAFDCGGFDLALNIALALSAVACWVIVSLAGAAVAVACRFRIINWSFSARALDRGFAGTLVGLARHAEPKLTPPQGVEQIADVRAALERKLLDVFLQRVRQQPIVDEAEREEGLRSVQNRVVDLLDSWRKIFDDYRAAMVAMQYQKEVRAKADPAVASGNARQGFRVPEAKILDI